MGFHGRKFGTLNPDDWVAEGDGLLVSARTLRLQWLKTRREFRSQSKRKLLLNIPPSTLSMLTGGPRASLLLLGYAAEMYLKSGVVKLYRGCRDGMTERDLKSHFGHDFSLIAKAISLPIDNASRGQLVTLKKLVLFDARYPISASSVPESDPVGYYTRMKNSRTGSEWSSKKFRELSRFVTLIKSSVQRLDRDTSNPASFRSLTLQNGGYIVMRCGGNLPWRITYRGEKNLGKPRTVDEIQQLAVGQEWIEAKFFWSRFFIFEDGYDKTVLLRTPVELLSEEKT